MNTPADLVAFRSWEVEGWELREVAQRAAGPVVLLLPGGLCSARFYDDVLAYAALDDPSARLVAATPPGFAGRPAPADCSVESYARAASALAADLGCRVIVGHSFGANLAIEMAASSGFEGSLVLISPSFSREDEFKELAVVDRIGRVPAIGALVWALVPRISASVLRSSLPPARREVLAAEIRRNQGRVCRRLVRRYFEYLDRTASLAERLCETGAETQVVFGDHDEVGLTGREQRSLENCPQVALEVIAGATHFLVTERPKLIAELALGAIATVSVG